MPRLARRGHFLGAFGTQGAGAIDFFWMPKPEDVADAIMEVASNLDDHSAPLGAAAVIMERDIDARFKTETDPEGHRWKPWSKSYAKRVPQLNPPHKGKILQWTGDLRRAATSPRAYKIAEDALFIDTSAFPPYWAAHQFGATRVDAASKQAIAEQKAIGHPLPEDFGANVLPARPYLGMSPEAELLTLEIFEQWFTGAIQLYVTSTGRIGRRHALRGTRGFIAGEG